MDLPNATVLVTGGAGLVGSHLAATLHDAGTTVRVADDLSKGTRERVPDGVTFTKADLTDRDDVDRVVTADLDMVFHLAAYTDTNFDDDRKLFEENTEMTYNLLEAMRDAGVENFAFTSSSTVYGEAPRPTPEDYGPLEPISIYGSSKLADEGLISTYAHSYGISRGCSALRTSSAPTNGGTLCLTSSRTSPMIQANSKYSVMDAKRSPTCMSPSVSLP